VTRWRERWPADVDAAPRQDRVEARGHAVPDGDAADRDRGIADVEHAVGDAVARRARRRSLIDVAGLDDRRGRPGAVDDEVVRGGVVDDVEIPAGGIVVVPGDRQCVRAGRHRDRVGLIVLPRRTGVDRDVAVRRAYRFTERAVAVGVELVGGRRDRDRRGVGGMSGRRDRDGQQDAEERSSQGVPLSRCAVVFCSCLAFMDLTREPLSRAGDGATPRHRWSHMYIRRSRPSRSPRNSIGAFARPF